jgi:hypothetical protein
VEKWHITGMCAVGITCSNAYPVSLERRPCDARRIELGDPERLNVPALARDRSNVHIGRRECRGAVH